MGPRDDSILKGGIEVGPFGPTLPLFPLLNIASSHLIGHFLLHPMTVGIHVSVQAVMCFLGPHVNGRHIYERERPCVNECDSAAYINSDLEYMGGQMQDKK